MTSQDIITAEELLCDADAEDCERFASRYGRALLRSARFALVAAEVLKAAHHALTVTQNLRATDLTQEVFDAHLGNDVPRDQLEWSIDHSVELARIEAALSLLMSDTRKAA